MRRIPTPFDLEVRDAIIKNGGYVNLAAEEMGVSALILYQNLKKQTQSAWWIETKEKVRKARQAAAKARYRARRKKLALELAEQQLKTEAGEPTT